MHSVKRLKIGCFIHKSNLNAFKDETDVFTHSFTTKQPSSHPLLYSPSGTANRKPSGTIENSTVF